MWVAGFWSGELLTHNLLIWGVVSEAAAVLGLGEWISFLGRVFVPRVGFVWL